MAGVETIWKLHTYCYELLISLIIKICHSYQATMLVAVLSSAKNAWKRRNSHISIIKYTSLIMKKHLAYVRDPLQNELIILLL